MHIIHIASEMARVAKVGGLGDVILGLSRQCAEDGHTVEVILPKYASIQYNQIRDLHVLHRDLWAFGGGRWHHNSVWAGWVEGIKVYLIEPHTPPHYFDREKVYGYEDDIERFIYFSRASLEFLLMSGLNPDILHLHEWHTGLIAPMLWDHFQPLGLDNPGVVFTMHNLQHQGICSPHELEKVGLNPKKYSSLIDDSGKLNLLRGGILFANHLTTVSPTYREEVLTPAEGRGLEHLLNANKHKFTGILNGVDYSLWGPSVDPLLPTAYSHDPDTWDGKQRCKQELQSRFSLAKEDRPLVGFVGRLVPQKGMDLVKHALFQTLEAGGQFVLLGSAATPDINEDFHALKIHFGDNPHVHLELHHHEELVHLIFAGSDMLLVPSRFEPCGLTQLIAIRYGSVPIARRCGGLTDTIFDMQNGFVFEEPTFDGMESALSRALECYHEDPQVWRRLMRTGMCHDFSWRKPALQYEEIYEAIRLTHTSIPATG